jgi:hypothetical protein
MAGSMSANASPWRDAASKARAAFQNEQLLIIIVRRGSAPPGFVLDAHAQRDGMVSLAQQIGKRHPVFGIAFAGRGTMRHRQIKQSVRPFQISCVRSGSGQSGEQERRVVEPRVRRCCRRVGRGESCVRRRRVTRTLAAILDVAQLS